MKLKRIPEHDQQPRRPSLRGGFSSDYVPKKLISIRLDQSILDWFKENHETGYQSAINDVLSRHVKASRTRG